MYLHWMAMRILTYQWPVLSVKCYDLLMRCPQVEHLMLPSHYPIPLLMTWYYHPSADYLVLS